MTPSFTARDAELLVPEAVTGPITRATVSGVRGFWHVPTAVGVWEIFYYTRGPWKGWVQVMDPRTFEAELYPYSPQPSFRSRTQQKLAKRLRRK